MGGGESGTCGQPIKGRRAHRAALETDRPGGLHWPSPKRKPGAMEEEEEERVAQRTSSNSQIPLDQIQLITQRRHPWFQPLLSLALASKAGKGRSEQAQGPLGRTIRRR